MHSIQIEIYQPTSEDSSKSIISALTQELNYVLPRHLQAKQGTGFINISAKDYIEMSLPLLSILLILNKYGFYCTFYNKTFTIKSRDVHALEASLIAGLFKSLRHYKTLTIEREPDET